MNWIQLNETWLVVLCKVKSRSVMLQKPILLDEMLRPIWKCLRFSGVHHRFLPVAETHRKFLFFRYVTTVLIVSLLVVSHSIHVKSLIDAILHKKKLTEIFISIVTTIYEVAVNLFLYQFYANHQQLVKFFNDWKQMELQYANCSNRKRTLIILIVYYLMVYSSLGFYGFYSFLFNLQAPDDPIFLSHFAAVQEVFNIYFLAFINGSYAYVFVLLIYLSEMLPAFFYYQAGCAVENLDVQLNNCSRSAYRVIWNRYETIRKLVKRANQLFGVMVLADQLGFICCTCLFLYSITFPHDHCRYCYMFLFSLMTVIARWLWLNWATSHWYLSCDILQNSVAATLSSKWQLMNEEQRRILTHLLLRLHKAKMAASPLNLYTIQPSNVLTLFTLLTTYVVFLLQSHDWNNHQSTILIIVINYKCYRINYNIGINVIH